MPKVEKMRMCPYCEGTNIVSAKTCRFCASCLEDDQQPETTNVHQHAENMQYTPPYAPSSTMYQDSVYQPQARDEEYAEDDQEQTEHGHIISLMLLSCGCMLLTISMLLFFFSQHGAVVLEWKSRYWSLYFLLGLPMVYYGIKKLREI